ncbi:uncharacterized protein STEHIDRAFT_54465 [Stereum hirsutum FP-91666 SS1]|uniref:uncharacterized protein n=1 Tax=Stereum hirsutum (strain FP-91666) TaxID=721885 RepID=UPI000440B41E|nr:uncharacterized protein STEHIDRAFT_54465 [Stereum hirsutum FP-91666 SS1]EIM88485.1 hypothetical protein STEHIDRAFT_54465 [Stereum hirsutum FP-91666 SS1]
MAITKQALKLRTVIQFVRIHQSSSDWRTILYLTIDHAPPPTHPHVFKYTNGDTSTLPFSYTLSSLPALLRDGDSALSKIYTIPPTNTTPLPSLPINLPSMANYLLSALDDARRSLGDSSSGLRKLAKMVEGCYPQDRMNGVVSSVEGAEGSERAGGRGVGGYFGVRKLFGRKGNKAGYRSGNADVYDLVTPFLPDAEYG